MRYCGSDAPSNVANRPDGRPERSDTCDPSTAIFIHLRVALSGRCHDQLRSDSLERTNLHSSKNSPWEGPLLCDWGIYGDGGGCTVWWGVMVNRLLYSNDLSIRVLARGHSSWLRGSYVLALALPCALRRDATLRSHMSRPVRPRTRCKSGCPDPRSSF